MSLGQRQHSAPQLTGRWGAYQHYRCKIGTHSTTLAIIKTVRHFHLGQIIRFCELRDVRGMCVGMKPRWQHGVIDRITPSHLFICR